METVESASLPCQAMYLMQMFDENWNEIEKLRRWTNDEASIMRVINDWRVAQFELAHGYTESVEGFAKVACVTLEVQHGK